MREKRRRLVVTFDTTTAAMALEDLCREQGLPGRLIPTPLEIDAQCGLAWCAPPETEAALETLMEARGLSCRGVCILMV